MGDRVLFQVVSKDSGKFGPVVYAHWSGENAPEIVRELKARMGTRTDDIAYATARLLQVAMGKDAGGTGFGVWNASAVLIEKDSHGDAGIVLIDADTYEPTYIGGYLARRAAQ